MYVDTMEIYLIRHTAVQTEKSVCYGQSDIPLSHTFQEDAVQVRNKLKKFDNGVIYSSPSQRCFQLAELLLPGTLPILDERLMELNFGNWELKKWEEINKTELDPWMKDFVNVPCSGGESYKELHQRSTAFFKECISQPFEKVLIITHGGVIRSLLSFILQVPLEKSFALQIDYGKISKLKLMDKENIIVEYINN